MQNKALEHLALPPLVIPVHIVNGAVYYVTQTNLDEFKNIFDWVDANSIRERILILGKSILWGQVCIIEINGDSKTITEYPPFTR